MSSKASQQKSTTPCYDLTVDQAQGRLKEWEDKVNSCKDDPEKKRFRQSIYRKIVKLKRAIENPEVYLNGGHEKKKRIEKERKRTEKKIAKSAQNTGRRNGSLKAKKAHNSSVICLLCRQKGHMASQCEQNSYRGNAKICYNCGSNDHGLSACDKERPADGTLEFANCFICKNNGHLASRCPESAKGVYPNGGCCHQCGSVQHLARDCPSKGKPKSQEASTAEDE
eukprot:CAMPEP_0114975574 /NCGR_PEP_ID=MMETSP0216-20121206/2182_1 /TAXON_ID=223996 /ORGANISM="Protocruzia adherens, Strain Boccale" /LENGTH=224 /DNA_ID=CAMNT_0002336385 /DNA_START=44 /DNA_END=718 /DNA_ORIENTATION=-